MTPPNWLRILSVVILCVLGVRSLSFWFSGRLAAGTSGLVDFTGIVAGAYLVGTPGLYEVGANLDIQRRLVGSEDPARVFPRWPYWAAALSPLARLPYSKAARLWRAALVAAFALFVVAFPLAPWWVSALAICWSIPAFDALGQGQDSPFLLIYLTMSILLHRANRPFAAGVALALCVAKYHFFVLTPLLILVQRRWSFLMGGLAGGGGLIAASFLVQGWSWPAEHLRNISRPEIDSLPAIMPNIRGVLDGYPMALPLEIAAAIAVAIWVGWLLKKANFEQGLMLVLIGGMLVSHHAYVHDSILLIPAFLTLGASLPECRLAAAIMLSPISTFLLSILPTPPKTGNVLFVLLLLGFLGWVSSEIGAAGGRKEQIRA